MVEKRIKVEMKDDVEIILTPEEMLEALKKKLIETEAECQRWKQKYMKLRDQIEEFYEQFFS